MSIPAKLLNEGEHVVLSTRTHVKVLFGAALVLLATGAGAGYLVGVVQDRVDPGTTRDVVTWLVVGVAVLIVALFVLRPFLRWYTSTYTFTNRRFIQRTGFLRKEGRTIPLNRISGVDFEMSVVDRLFRCGTLVVSDASEQGRVPLPDIPRVEEVQRLVAAQLHQTTSGAPAHDDGT